MHEISFYRKNGYYPYPKTMQLEVTTACPLRCPQCFIDEFNPVYMQWDEYTRIMDEAAQIGVKGVVLFGGEPMLHKEIFRMIEYALEREITIFFYTSGWSFTDEAVARMKTYGKSFVLLMSLNGATKEIHEISRDQFDTTMNAIRRLQAHEVTYGINWVSRHDNVFQLPDLINLAREHGAAYINVVSNKISSDYVTGQPLTLADYPIILQAVRNNPGYVIVENCNEMLSNLLSGDKKNKFSGCNAGITNCSVASDLSFVPCLRLMHKERYPTIMEYWTKSEVLARLRQKAAGSAENCKGCQFEGKCNYCRASSKETYYDFHAGLKNCVLKKVSA